MANETLYLGLDFGTEELKAVAINDGLRVMHQATVQYHRDIPEIKISGGFHYYQDRKTVTYPTIMWVKALDMILDLLRLDGLDFSKVASVSGSAQQYGSVYWNKGAEEILLNLNPKKFLQQQLKDCFSIRNSPVYLDYSTSDQCKKLEIGIGGPLQLAKITGSRAYERFTGNQIAKLFDTRPDDYNNTERISLISSFAASLFLGQYAAIDLSDGSSMNLLDINEKDWSDECLQLCAPELRGKLGKPVPSCRILGWISSYFIERYGFPENCSVVAFTGDNPALFAAFAGTYLNKGDMVISLGMNDRLFLWLTEPTPSLDGHILCHPLDSKDFMALLCFKNGSLIRERIRDDCADGSWDQFSDLLECTPRGNFGNIGMYFDMMEVHPPVCGDYRFDKNNKLVQHFSKVVEVRALVEGQFLAKRVHAENLGFSIDSTSKIIATGGASTNTQIIQVLSDIFNLPVYILNVPNSACLGSALRAKHGLLGKEFSFQERFNEPVGLNLCAKPSKDAAQIYQPMLMRYRILEERCLEEKFKSLQSQNAI